jgi:magnesium chelatase accessory protein
MMPELAKYFRVIAPDFPGQGFSALPRRSAIFTLPGMSRALADLLITLKAVPEMIVGHSAGCAVGARMALDGLASPKAIVGINAALLPFHAVNTLYSGLAKLLALNPLVPWFVSSQARHPRAVERLIDETGSRLDEHGVALYRHLAQQSSHVAGTLRMMANWNLDDLRERLPKLHVPLVLMVGSRDRTIDPDRAHEIRRLLPAAEVLSMHGLGHLAHEEEPSRFTTEILRLARRFTVIGGEDV